MSFDLKEELLDKCRCHLSTVVDGRTLGSSLKSLV
jgi:hypothetical protein